MSHTAHTTGASIPTDQARHPAGIPHGGQWRETQREGSGLTLHGEGERQGSALFPPRFNDWSAQEYIDWWENVPLDDDVLMNTQRAYEQHMEYSAHAYCTEAVQAWKEVNPDPTLPTSPYVKDKDLPFAIGGWKDGVDKAWTEAEERFFSEFERIIPDVSIRPVYRAYKMDSYSVGLAETEQARVQDHVMPISEGLTVRETTSIYPMENIDNATRTKRTDALLDQLSNAIANQNHGD